MQRLIDSLVRPIGLSLSLGVLLAFALAAGVFFDRLATDIAGSQGDLAQQRQANFETAFLELTQLSLAARSLALADELTPEKRAAIERAVDTLYVRAEHLSLQTEDRSSYDFAGSTLLHRTASATVASLKGLVQFSDAQLASDTLDTAIFSAQIDEAVNEILSRLSAYFIELNRAEQDFLERNGTTLQTLSRAFWVFLVIVCVAAVLNTLLLRREIRERKKREEVEQRAEFLAYFDTLTELPNRVHFKDHVMARLAAGEEVSIIFLDIDDFKEVNDRMGQSMGDALLKEIAARSELAALRFSGFTARLGGDEFGFCLSIGNNDDLRDAAQSIAAVVSKPVLLGGDEITPVLSIGAANISSISAAMPPTFETALRVTDFALHVAKEERTTSIAVYDKELENRFIERRAMLHELPDAIGRGDLEIFCQPKVDMETNRTLGFEALVRWRRKGRIVAPVEFISIAEEGGFIVNIDRFVMDRAVAALADWNHRYGTDFSMSVNISANHLLRADLPDFVAHTLDRYDLPPELLTLEITESVELEDWSRVRSSIVALSDVGVKISIDDFGTGYSSLAYLRTIRAHELKIDRSLVSEVEESDEARFIVDAVMDLARSLNLEVVVEGIERQSQICVLTDLGCVIGQGYLFGKPKPAEESFADATFKEGEAAATPAGVA